MHDIHVQARELQVTAATTALEDRLTRLNTRLGALLDELTEVQQQVRAGLAELDELRDAPAPARPRRARRAH